MKFSDPLKILLVCFSFFIEVISVLEKREGRADRFPILGVVSKRMLKAFMGKVGMLFFLIEEVGLS